MSIDITQINGEYLRKKTKRKREEKEEESKKRARDEYAKVLRKCLESCDYEAGQGGDQCIYSTHDPMLNDASLIKTLKERGIDAFFFTKKCNSSLCDCEGEMLNCYSLQWPENKQVDGGGEQPK